MKNNYKNLLIFIFLSVNFSCNSDSNNNSVDDNLKEEKFIFYVNGNKVENNLPVKIEKLGTQITITGEYQYLQTDKSTDVYTIVLSSPVQGGKVILGDSASPNYFYYNLWGFSSDIRDRYVSKSGTVEILILNDSICTGKFDIIAGSSFGKEDRHYTKGQFYGKVVKKK